ncbi:MAG: hypothetical protein WA080_02670 [Sulfuricurvum sp.]
MQHSVSGIKAGDNDRIASIVQETDLMRVGHSRRFGTRIFAFINSVVHTAGLVLVLSIIIKNPILLIATAMAILVILVMMENIRAYVFSKYYTSVLRAIVLNTKEKIIIKIDNLSLILVIIASLVYFSMSFFTAIELKDRFKHSITEAYVKSSGVYQSAQAQAQSGARNTEIYVDLLNKYRIDKRQHDADCNKQWSGDFRTKNIECKENFNQKPPVATDIKTSSYIGIAEYKEIETKESKSLSDVFNVLFFIIVSVSVFFDYMAINTIMDEFKDKREKLTQNTILQLKSRVELEQLALENKLEKLNENQRKVHKDHIDLEVNIFDNYSRQGLARLKRLDKHGKNLLSVISGGGNPNPAIQREGLLDLSGFGSGSDSEKKRSEELIKKLWNEGAIGEGDYLTPKSAIVKNVFDKADLESLYARLTSIGAINRPDGSKGYRAILTMQDALKCLE